MLRSLLVSLLPHLASDAVISLVIDADSLAVFSPQKTPKETTAEDLRQEASLPALSEPWISVAQAAGYDIDHTIEYPCLDLASQEISSSEHSTAHRYDALLYLRLTVSRTKNRIPTVATIVPVSRSGTGFKVYLQHRITASQKDSEYEGMLEFPQGHLEDGESFLEAANRELLEESGLIINRLYSFSTGGVPDLGQSFEAEISRPLAAVALRGRLNYLSVVFLAETVRRDSPTGALKNRGIWITPSELQELADSGRVFPLNLPLAAAITQISEDIKYWLFNQ
ncbi:NUDIX domain-containing protein [Pseudarthrobacter sp. C4D7]|nr:NUDIX domain-containing protein [Pseudarthrobacter sp. C4D7]NUT72762.1 NUDIX domain-containing protein [Pseudarthrobacter sp. C4D7]